MQNEYLGYRIPTIKSVNLHEGKWKGSGELTAKVFRGFDGAAVLRHGYLGEERMILF